jgi:GTP cyclohydrolase I
MFMALMSEVARSVIPLDSDRRVVSDEQMRRFEGYMGEIFDALQMDHSPSTADTPRRFLRALVDATGGYDGDPKLVTVFESEYGDSVEDQANQVIEGPIRFHALCEHHALPFFGEAWVGYIPGDRILGISKLVRLVQVYARRFTLQERLGQEVAATLEAMIDPRGVAVAIEATHLCTRMRGVGSTSAQTRTTCWRGAFSDDSSLRSEFLRCCRWGG